MIKLDRLARFAWVVLIYNLFVVVFGGFVRASGSGAGCGSHWPLCNGDVVPRAPQVETIIEFTHRITSGLTVLLVIGLAVWVWRKYRRGSLERWASGGSVLFIFTESLIGAGLVLFGLTADNDSVVRAFSMMAHLVNTFLLLAFLTLTAWLLTFGAVPRQAPKGSGFEFYWLGAAGMFLLGASGAVTALGDTLFPVSSFAEGFRQEFSDAAHYLLRLRLFHPPIAVLVSFYILWVMRRWKNTYNFAHLHRINTLLTVLVVAQLGLGMLNVWLAAPIWLQLVHLLMTTLVWITYVLAGIAGRVAGDLALRIGQDEIQQGVEPSTA